jgi:hypothetical protein
MMVGDLQKQPIGGERDAEDSAPAFVNFTAFERELPERERCQQPEGARSKISREQTHQGERRRPDRPSTHAAPGHTG